MKGLYCMQLLRHASLPEARVVTGYCRKALWQGFVRACDRVEREIGNAGEDPNAAVLDWFGVGIKAAEMAMLVSRMKLLARKASILRSYLSALC